MLPESTSLHCDARMCIYTHQHTGQGAPVERAPTPVQLDAVYRAFRENRFDRIGMSHHEVVYDRGSVSISLRADERDYRISPSATEDVSERDAPRFQRVRAAIERLIVSLFGNS